MHRGFELVDSIKINFSENNHSRTRGTTNRRNGFFFFVKKHFLLSWTILFLVLVSKSSRHYCRIFVFLIKFYVAVRYDKVSATILLSLKCTDSELFRG